MKPSTFKRILDKIRGTRYHNNVEIVEIDDGDALVLFGNDRITYTLDLEWDRGVMDVQFGVVGENIYDTTNTHHQYKTLNTISRITQNIADMVENKTGEKFHTLVFKSSHVRNGEIDTTSSDIRNRFFSRYVTRLYPNAEISNDKNNSIIIKLNRV